MSGFSCNRNLLMLAGPALAFLAGVYVVWGPDSRSKKKKQATTCPGLVNFGNSCFLNSILQALAPSVSVSQWMTRFKDEWSTDSVADSLHRTIKVLNNESVEHRDEYNAIDVMTALKAKRWVISTDEQDAHELFHVLTETLNEEVEMQPATLSLFEAYRIEDKSISSVGHNRIQTDLPLVSSLRKKLPFTGTLASQLQCQTCGFKKPIRHDHFDSLSLTLQSAVNNSFSLYNLVSNYMNSETVDMVECEGCAKNIKSRLKPKTTFCKKLTISKLPKCLCIHIQRTTMLDCGMPMKRRDHIHFPEILNMAAYVYQNQLSVWGKISQKKVARLVGGRNLNCGDNKIGRRPDPLRSPYSKPVNMLKALHYQRGQMCLPSISDNSGVTVQQLATMYSNEQKVNSGPTYKLVSVICHFGDVFSGHFVTYRRAPNSNGQRFPNQWLYCSDNLVKQVPLTEVLSAEAYMLMYDRV